MKSITLVALTSLVLGTVGFAPQANAQPPISRSFKYWCEVETQNYGKEGPETCRVKGKVCERRLIPLGDIETVPQECRDGKDPVEVECSRGWDLKDRDAATTFKGDDAWVIGTEHGHAAILKIDDVRGPVTLDEIEGHTHRAELTLTNEVARVLKGRCTVKYFGKPAQPTEGSALR